MRSLGLIPSPRAADHARHAPAGRAGLELQQAEDETKIHHARRTLMPPSPPPRQVTLRPPVRTAAEELGGGSSPKSVRSASRYYVDPMLPQQRRRPPLQPLQHFAAAWSPAAAAAAAAAPPQRSPRPRLPAVPDSARSSLQPTPRGRAAAVAAVNEEADDADYNSPPSQPLSPRRTRPSPRRAPTEAPRNLALRERDLGGTPRGSPRISPREKAKVLEGSLCYGHMTGEPTRVSFYGDRQPPAVTRVTTGEMIGHELRRETEEEARHIVKEAQNAYLEEHKKSIISNRRVR